MMKTLLAGALACALGLFLCAGVAQADTILFDQPLDQGSDRGPFADIQFSQQIADQFTLATTATVSQVDWYGSYHTNDLPGGTTNVAFRVRFFADAAGSPAIGHSFEQLLSASVLNSGLTQEGRIIYSFSTGISGFTALGGTQYWVSIHDMDAANGIFRWANAVGGGAGTHAFRSGDGIAWNVNSDGVRGNDAFTLVPEPSMALLLLGAAGLFSCRRYRRRQYRGIQE